MSNEFSGIGVRVRVRGRVRLRIRLRLRLRCFVVTQRHKVAEGGGGASIRIVGRWAVLLNSHSISYSGLAR